MKRRITFFLVVTLAASLAHYLIVLGLTQVVVSGAGASSVVVPVLWVLAAPMNFLLSSSFGHTLSPMPFQVLFTANSLLWGFVVGSIILWRRLRYE